MSDSEEKTIEQLEMRIAELEDKLGQTSYTEEEVKAYNKIADALGVAGGLEEGQAAAGTAAPCRVQGPTPCRIQPCRIQPCRIQPCRIQPCRIQPCRIQPCRIQQCINECAQCFSGGGLTDMLDDGSGGFGGLGF